MKPVELLATLQRMEGRLEYLEARVITLQSLLIAVCGEPKPEGGYSKAALQRIADETLQACAQTVANRKHAPPPGGSTAHN